MSTLLDIVGSTVIGGIVILMVLNVNSNYVTYQGKQSLSKIVQTNATTASAIIEHDVRKIGYRRSDSIKILAIDSTKITALGDFDNNGVVDSLKYYLDSSTPAYTAPSNTRIRFLYRQINSLPPSPINLGFTKFRVWYLDSLEAQTTIRSNVRSLRVAFTIESPYKYETKTQYDKDFYSLYWERSIKPKNLR